MVTTFMEKQQKQLIKKFHVLLGKAGIGREGKEAILSSYGVESSLDLTAKDLMDICDKLAMQANPKLAEADRWRKRVIRAIFAYCEAAGREADMDYVKAIACRATGYRTFNEIPVARLNNLYNTFKDKVKDIKSVSSIVNSDLLNNVNLN
jgi:hypothetical protein